MRGLHGTVERKIAAIASRQHGVVTRQQLLARGISSRQIERRLRAGSVFRVHRGVYRVGHLAPSDEATYLCAVFAGGTDAVLCGLAAGHLYGITGSRSAPSPEVSARVRRRIAG